MTQSKIRKPVFSGMWYPKNQDELLAMLKHFFKEVHSIEQHKDKKPLGIIAPHAGYVYSGQVAAYGYSFLQENQFDTVILFGSSHRYLENTISIYNGDSYQTPLGTVNIDNEIASALLEKHNHFSYHDYIHQAEHSLEAQVPFLQYKLKQFEIVPILTATRSRELLLLLADVLINIIKKTDKKILLVCSTDMSHYHSYEVGKKMDMKTIQLILEKKWDELEESIRLGVNELCGYYGMIPFLKTLQHFQAEQGELLCYANSGDAMGDTNASQVVGYMAMLFPQEEG